MIEYFTDAKIQTIPVKDLVLWTENPRDPISPTAIDSDIVQRALTEKSEKWSLKKLSESMGDFYDFSELPTVVYHGDKPIVYDGNRRVILGKIKLGVVPLSASISFNIPPYPDSLPCCVCKQSVALASVYRKHADTGSWDPLERDIFLHRHMSKPKSTFLVIEESTGIIGKNPLLNKRFVKEEVFTDERLNKLGFSISRGRLHSKHSIDKSNLILSNVAQLITDGEVTTRKNRGNVFDLLSSSSKEIIAEDLQKPAELYTTSQKVQIDPPKKPYQPRRIARSTEIFGGKLSLRSCETGNLYRDIRDLYDFYDSNKDNQDPSKRLSLSFPAIIRMSLRLLCETAASSNNESLDT